VRDVEQIQRRPGMYVGDTSNGAGLHAMVFEALNNAAGEVRAGHAARIKIDLHPDQDCVVRDDGRGIVSGRVGSAGSASPDDFLTNLRWIDLKRSETIPNVIGLAPVTAQIGSN
jgi:DNA gyrase subunit B